MLLLRNSANTVFLLLMGATCSTIFISKCKLKISNMPTQNASYTYKIIKIHPSPKIPKANQMLISYFPHITVSSYWRFGISYRSIFKGQEVLELFDPWILVCLEMSVNNYHSTIRYILEEKMPQFLLRIGNQKWRWPQIFSVKLQLSTVYNYLFIYAPPNYVLRNILY